MNRTNDKPIPGDVLSVNRGLYKHYGVYIGNDEVVHFSGGAENELSAERACIRKTSLEEFRGDGEIEIEANNCGAFSHEETAARARAAVGSEKGKYDLAWNNCEHFANWCRYGKKRSLQVERAAVGFAGMAILGLGVGLIAMLSDQLDIDFI